jgi:hypothetical protein
MPLIVRVISPRATVELAPLCRIRQIRVSARLQHPSRTGSQDEGGRDGEGKETAGEPWDQRVPRNGSSVSRRCFFSLCVHLSFENRH